MESRPFFYYDENLPENVKFSLRKISGFSVCAQFILDRFPISIEFILAVLYLIFLQLQLERQLSTIIVLFEFYKSKFL